MTDIIERPWQPKPDNAIDIVFNGPSAENGRYVDVIDDVSRLWTAVWMINHDGYKVLRLTKLEISETTL